MKVKFLRYLPEYTVPDDISELTIGSIYEVIRLSKNDLSTDVWVMNNNGDEAPIFESEYEIVES